MNQRIGVRGEPTRRQKNLGSRRLASSKTPWWEIRLPFASRQFGLTFWVGLLIVSLASPVCARLEKGASGRLRFRPRSLEAGEWQMLWPGNLRTKFRLLLSPQQGTFRTE